MTRICATIIQVIAVKFIENAVKEKCNTVYTKENENKELKQTSITSESDMFIFLFAGVCVLSFEIWLKLLD